MFGFRGRFDAKQYTPKKPVKWVIKVFNVADSRNGYLLDTLVYTGANTPSACLGRYAPHAALPR